MAASPATMHEFATADFASLLELGAKTSGSGVFINGKGGKVPLFVLSGEQCFYPRADKKAESYENARLDYHIRLSESADVTACETFDTWLRTAVYPRLSEFMPAKAGVVKSVDALAVLQKSMYHGTQTSSDGKTYAGYIKAKIPGWGGYIASTRTRSVPWGDVPDSHEWTSRLTPPGPNDTQFYLITGKDPVTGADRVTNKVRVGVAGETRSVGPQDFGPGMKIKVVIRPSTVYFTEGLGPVFIVCAVYGEPLPPKAPVASALSLLPGMQLVDEDM